MGIILARDKITKNIDKKLKQEEKQKAQKEEIRLLLLGTGGSGKSTLVRQMKMLRTSGYENTEKQYFRDHISLNLAEWTLNLADKIKETDITFNLASRIKVLAEWCRNQATNVVFPLAIQSMILEVQHSPLSATKQSGINELPDSAVYFFRHAERIMKDDFTPNAEDIVRCRVATNGVYVLQFPEKLYSFSIIDVGGQRGQRKKWIHFFDDINGMIYVTAISDYDRSLVEDGVTNRIIDSLDLWHGVVRYPGFAKLSIIVFFNKKDVFEEKIKRVPLTVCFPEFKTIQQRATAATKDEVAGPGADPIQPEPPPDVPASEMDVLEHAKDFIEKKFTERAGAKEKIYMHFTTATDKGNVEMVMQMTIDIILDANMRGLGI